MKKILCLLMVLFMLLGCGNVNTENIENWDIPIKDIESVEIKKIFHDKSTYVLDKEDGLKLIEAFNNIKTSDIHWDLSEENQDCTSNIAIITVKTKTEEIKIYYSPFGTITYNEYDYFTYFNLEYYDFMRVIGEKYNISFINWEEDLFKGNNGFGVSNPSDVVCSPTKKVNDVLKSIGCEEQVDEELTIQDIIDSYEGELVLNDIIEYENMSVKVIEFNEDNKISAVIFHYDE